MIRTCHRALALLLAALLMLGGALAECDAILDAPVEEVEAFELGEDGSGEEASIDQEREIPIEITDETGIEVASEALEAENASKLKLDPITLAVGQSKALEIPVSGTQYKSSNTKVATVGLDSGIVKGIKAGSAVITARIPGYGDFTCDVTVKKAPTKVTLNQTKLTLKSGDTARLTGKLSPTGAYMELTFSSSDASVARVDDDGTVTATGSGKAIITVSTHNGKTAKCTVTVTGGGGSRMSEPTGITLDRTEAVMNVKGTLTLTGQVEPKGIKTTLTFSSSNTSVATVTSKGKVTAKKAGYAIITVRTSNGLTAACEITVTSPPTKIALSKTSATISVGETLTLDTAIQPAGAETELTWTTSSASVAQVSEGTITGVKAGKATITVRTSNGKKATCKVTVKAAEKLTVKAAKSTLKVGGSTTVTANMSPVYWSVEGDAVTVDQKGRVKAITPGEASVWAQTAAGAVAGVVISVEGDVWDYDEPDDHYDEPSDSLGGYIIDISQYQGNVNFDKLAPSVSLVILRATLSTTEDTRFASYAEALNARGIPFGVYCYSKASTVSKARAEAEQLYRVAKGYKPKFYVLDAEYNTLSQSTIEAFVQQLRASGAKKIGCYIAHNKYSSFGYANVRDQFDFTWIPRYGKNNGTLESATAPAYECDLWQYTSNGTVPGISGQVDMNVVTGQGRSLSWFIS